MVELLPKALGIDVVRVVTGGAHVAAAFLSLPCGHLLFTGSTTIADVGERPHPLFALALYLFSDSSAQQERVLQATLVAGVSFNETLMHIALGGLPLGGVGPSGMRQHHGRFGFDTTSKLKAGFRQSRINAMELFAPPYGAFFSRMIKFMLRSPGAKSCAGFEPSL